MKDLYKLFTLAMGLLALFACETDRNSNLVLNEPDASALNVPALTSNSVYDLKDSGSLELICTQPNYGIPMATTYSVQISLEENFIDTHVGTNMEASYATLGTTHSSAKVGVKALGFALALGDLWSASSDEEFPTTPIPVYVCLEAELASSDRGTAFSSIIELPKVLGCKTVPPLELPSSILTNGSMADNDWSNWVPLAAINGMSKFFGLPYFRSIDMFKFGTKEGKYIGFNDPRLTMASDALTGSDDGFGGQNTSINVTGWYTMITSVNIKGTDYAFTLDITPGEIYLIDNTIGDWTFDDKGKFQAPTTTDADFISPVCTGGRESRISVKVPRGDWWRTEFAIPNGEVMLRKNKSVIGSWSGIDPEYAINVKAGQKVNLNFVQKAGSVTQ